MADEEILGTTLRDTIEQAYDDHVTPSEPNEKPAIASQPAPEAAATAEGAAAVSDARARGADGKFIQKTAEEKTPEKAVTQPAAVPQAPATVVTPRPSSWKKDFDGHWQKLDPAVQQYVLQREGEFAKGVSTYKQEFDQLKPLSEALQPFMPHLQQAGIQPGQWISNLGNAHLQLARGNDQQRLSMFLKLAQDYNVPVQQLFQRGQDGQIYYNPQVQAYQPSQQSAQAQAQQPDVRTTVQQILMQERAQQSLAEFERDVPTKYPHYESVKEDMALLLEAGKAPDFPSAYSMSLRLHDDLWASTQEEKRKADEVERQRKAQETVAHARRNAVSTRSSTPANKQAPAGGKKTLRQELEESYDETVGGARV